MRIDWDDFVFKDFMASQYRFSRQSIVIAAEGVHDVIRIGMLLLTVDSRATNKNKTRKNPRWHKRLTAAF